MVEAAGHHPEPHGDQDTVHDEETEVEEKEEKSQIIEPAGSVRGPY